MYKYTNANFLFFTEYMEKEKHNLLKVGNISFVFWFSIFAFKPATNVFIEYKQLLETYLQLESWKYCQNCHIVYCRTE